jgi:hypothetical protein
MAGSVAEVEGEVFTSRHDRSLVSSTSYRYAPKLGSSACTYLNVALEELAVERRRTPERVGGDDLPNHNCGPRDLLTAVVISDTNAQNRWAERWLLDD